MPRSQQQVLLVLENVDSLFEGGGDARDRLVKLLSDLCSRGDNESLLKLLVTSEQPLQHDTKERFRSGSEMVAKVEPLSRTDSSRFLIENIPRPFSKAALGLQPYTPCSNADILEAVQAHPVLKEVLAEAEGHPGTLVREGREQHAFSLSLIIKPEQAKMIDFLTNQPHT